MDYGPYSLLRRLGAGGMAEVFEAVRRDGEGPRVALKRVLPEHAADPDFARMFADEIRIASSVRDEHVLAVIDARAETPTQYLALELFDGVDAANLQGAVRRGELVLTQGAVAYLGAAVARGLFAAHEAKDERGQRMNVVHRDVSPGNVFVRRDGAVKLGDFGVAFARDREARTVTGVVKGKLAFMAPEQLAGDVLDPRADLFSLGCTLHAIAAGASPFKSLEQLASLLKGGSLDLSDALPDELRAVLSVALETLPTRRFATALAMAEALDRLVLDRDAARQELASAVEALSARAPARPQFDALWSLDESIESEPSPLGESIVHLAAVDTVRDQRSEVVAEPAPRAPRPSRRAPYAAAVAMALLVGGAVAHRMQSTSDRSGGDAAARATIVAPGVVAQRSSTRADEPDAQSMADVAVSLLDERPADPNPSAHIAVRSSTTALTHRRTPENPLVQTLVAPSAEGWIRVGFEGEALSGARVIVDGVDRGWAPTRVSVPAGSRRVVVRTSEGRTLLDERVAVGEEHTRLSPLAVLVRSR